MLLVSGGAYLLVLTAGGQEMTHSRQLTSGHSSYVKCASLMEGPLLCEACCKNAHLEPDVS